MKVKQGIKEEGVRTHSSGLRAGKAEWERMATAYLYCRTPSGAIQHVAAEALKSHKQYNVRTHGQHTA